MTDAALPELPHGRFEGREAFRQALRDALAHAAHAGWRELILADVDFRDWPLGERAVVEALQQWARSHRRITLLALDYDGLVREQPRFVHWRVRWEHIVTCRKAQTSDPLALPSALWSPHWVLARIDARRCTMVAGDEPDRRLLLRQQLQEWLEHRSTPGFPSSVLGL